MKLKFKKSIKGFQYTFYCTFDAKENTCTVFFDNKQTTATIEGKYLIFKEPIIIDFWKPDNATEKDLTVTKLKIDPWNLTRVKDYCA